MPFAVGDVVQLTSGGPLMTVARVADNEDGLVSCKFFNGGTLCSETIAPALLRKVPQQ